MSGALASFVALSIFAVVLAPLALAFRVPRYQVGIGAGCAAAILATGVYAAGTFRERPSVPPVMTVSGTGGLLPRQCEQIFQALQQANIPVDRSNPQQPVANQELWEQLPQPVRDAISRCLRRDAPAAPETAAPPLENDIDPAALN